MIQAYPGWRLWNKKNHKWKLWVPEWLPPSRLDFVSYCCCQVFQFCRKSAPNKGLYQLGIWKPAAALNITKHENHGLDRFIRCLKSPTARHFFLFLFSCTPIQVEVWWSIEWRWSDVKTRCLRIILYHFVVLVKWITTKIWNIFAC